MIDSAKPIDDATPLNDISGLKLPKNKSYPLKEIYVKEAENIADATIKYLSKNKTFDVYEIASRLHHRAVQIHPFQNGNGRWSRMLANIYLRQKGLMPVKWQEDLVASENPKRSEYIQALKKADNRNYTNLIEMHKITY